MSFLQLLINGFALGMAYALVALSFVLVLNAVSAVNFAQGDLVMAGGYVGVALAHVLPVPAIILLPAVLVVVACLGLVLSLLAYFPIMRRPPAAVFISTIAFGVILQNSYQLIFGPQAHAVRPLWSSGVVHFGDLAVSRQAIGIVATAAVLMAAQYYVMEKTQFGRRLRATAQNRDMAAALGIPVKRMIMVTFAASAALAGAAGLLLGNQFLVHPIGGVQLIIAAYIAAVIGGWGSLMGAVLGAMLIALFEVIVSAYVSYTAATAMLYLVVLIVLFFVPKGCSAKASSGVSDRMPDQATGAERRPMVVVEWLRSGVNMPLLVTGLAFAGYTLIYGNPYSYYVMAIAGSYALLVVGFQFIFGHAGAVSLAQAAFFGIGAYISGLLGIKLGWSFHYTFPLAIIGPMLIAVVVAMPVLKLEEHYFALATMGLGLVALLITTQWVSLTGGMNGLAGVPNFVVFGFEVGTRYQKLIFIWCVVAAGALLSRQIMRGLYGLQYTIARENSTAAMSVGVNVSILRFTAFVISASYAGAAGALIAHQIRVVSPQNLEFAVMITCLTMTVIGGRTSVAGGILAAVILIHLPEWFRVLQDYRLLAFGAVALFMVVVAPEGLVGALAALRARFFPEPPARLPIAKLHKMRRSDNGSRDTELLTVQGMTKSFGGIEAVKDVSLELRPGEIFGLIGPNGSGKTTLLNLISGVYMPDRGRVLFAGEDVTRYPAHAISRLGLSRTFQNINLVGDMSALDNVAVARSCVAQTGLWKAVKTVNRDVMLDHAREHAMALLDAVGASDIAGQRCDSLPYGVKRRVEIARALAIEPHLLLLDEPAAGLNEAEQLELSTRLENLAKSGLTMLVIEHNMRFLLPLAQRMSCLDHGEFIASGTPDEIVSEPAVIEAYLGKPEDEPD